MPKAKFIFIGVLCLLSELAMAQITRLEISDGWMFSQLGSEDWREAIVPGSVQFNLLKNNLIPDPFVATNEDSIRWIEQKKWIFKKQWKEDAVPSYDHYFLVFKGIDTYAEVVFNGDTIFHADNMFRTWRFNVSQLIQPENTLELIFTSPDEYHRLNPLFTEAKIPHDGAPARPLTRKAAYHFGWDWGLRLVTMGLWRPVFLEKSQGISMNECTVVTRVDEVLDGQINIDLKLSNKLESSLKLDAFIQDSLVKTWSVDSIQSNLYSAFSKPQLWWPSGYGEPHLYRIKLVLRDGDQVLDEVIRKIGFRSIERRKEKDSLGTSFGFWLNGIPVFCKGANYVPLSHFNAQHGISDYREMLINLVKANMNTIRVWGGGVYENDEFYSLCDSLGIMVWQDFMFANSMYHESLNENIKIEVEENVKRLAHHPAIIHWCGNNEIDVAWKNWGWQDQYGIHDQDSVHLENNYHYLFHNQLPDLLLNNLPDASYSHTSPLSNWGADENYNHSTMHAWGVYHGGDPFWKYAYQVGRFVTEFGFQSFPSPETLDELLGGAERERQELILKQRQKSYKGNQPILDLVSDLYGEPSDLKTLAHLSQLAQARVVAYGIQQQRSQPERCRGSLYWQLNDVWPAISWSSIDYNGRWKPLHYTVKRTFKEPGIFVDTTNGRCDMVVTNTSRDTLKGQVEISSGHKKKVTIAYEVPAMISHRFPLKKFKRCKYIGLFEEKRDVHIVHFKDVPKRRKRRGQITWNVQKIDSSVWQIEVWSAEPREEIGFTSSCTGLFTDNYIDILPNKKRTIQFVSHVTDQAPLFSLITNFKNEKK